jgi:phosphosulfolactate phosphohydrolase-like enzyme
VQEIALTAEENAEREVMAAEYAAQKAQEELDKATRAEAKAELLERLGITEEEAKLLLG